MPGSEGLVLHRPERGEAALAERRVPGLTLLAAYERLLAASPRDEPVLFDGGGWGAIAVRPGERISLQETWIADGEALTTSQALARVREALARWRPEAAAGLPPFVGGWAGFLGFEASREFERLPRGAPDDVGLPRAHLRFYTAAMVPAPDGVHVYALGREPEEAQAAVTQVVGDLSRAVRRETRGEPPERPARADWPRAGFEGAVRRALHHIREGDIYQVNLAQRFTGPCDDAWGAYLRARALNPSPCMGFLPGDGWTLASNSPERLVAVRGRDALTSPIAGTRPRGATPRGDAALEAELRRDGKENAEHVMLVDLERNDLGKVCAYGSVGVAPAEFCTVERYSHVMHLVSHVRGRLAQGRDALDALLAVFPGGTISGVPKVRACEVIDELEPVARGPYTGALGYLSVTGDADWNLLIRTLVTRGREGHVSVGAGIVADSDPGREFAETVAKGAHWFRVLGWRAP